MPEVGPLGPDSDGERTRVILHLEDDDASAYMFRLAVREANANAQLFRVSRVDEAMAFLGQLGAYVNVPRPDVAVLDINLPGQSGFEVLKAIRSDPALESLPVVIFSASGDTADRSLASDLGVDGFVVKGMALAEFVAAAETALELSR